MMEGRPFDTLDVKRRLEEQARRYEKLMGREKGERQKRLAEAERKQRPKPKGKP